MNCENCGAPLREARNRHYFSCDFCSSLFFPRQTDEGVVVLTELADLPCPICRTHLMQARIEGVAVFYCQGCRGILAKPENFRRFVGLRRGTATGPARRPPPLDPTELQRKIPCPSCRRVMEVHPYYGPGNAIIDACDECALIWLDHGELTVIVDAPGRDRAGKEIV